MRNTILEGLIIYLQQVEVTLQAGWGPRRLALERVNSEWLILKRFNYRPLRIPFSSFEKWTCLSLVKFVSLGKVTIPIELKIRKIISTWCKKSCIVFYLKACGLQNICAKKTKCAQIFIKMMRDLNIIFEWGNS